jgi:glycogen debranching enzyme
VKSNELLRRGSLQTVWDEKHSRLTTQYRNDTFKRGLHMQIENAGSPPEFANGGLSFRVAIAPGETWHVCMHWIVDMHEGVKHPIHPCHDLLGDDPAQNRLRREWLESSTRFDPSDDAMALVLARAVEDLASMRLHEHDETAAGEGEPARSDLWVPAAGIPWFVSLFGRDSLIVSLQTLSLSHRLACGSLRALASFQADGYDDDRDMEPGKIHHELRRGELATLKLIPHTPYYGTHDATPLFVLAASEAWRWHGDRGTLDALRPHVERALAWIDSDGDRDGDGLLEYATRSSRGNYNHGWKDSGDAITTALGGLAEAPIALCEIQGYVVAAKRAWAGVLESAYGEHESATKLYEEADELAALIEDRFWWEDEGTYYLGLDADKQPIKSVTSNAGHLLWSGAIAPERASRVAERLLADDMWSGWGVRTLSNAHPAFNPFSYQLGSVWPHDNAIIAAGFRRYGFNEEAHIVVRGLFDAAERFEFGRLPELFAGFTRDGGSFPVQYLGANVPQAWASGAVVHMVATMLGLRPEAAAGTLTLTPCLPEWMDSIEVAGMRVGEASTDFRIDRDAAGHHRLEARGRTSGVDVILT